MSSNSSERPSIQSRGVEGSAFSPRREGWRKVFYGSSDSERGRIIDCVVSVVMLIFAALVGTLYATPFERPFFEGDDSISFPVVAHETVPFHMLLVYAILIPALCVIAIPLIVRWHIGFSETIRPVTDVVLAVVGLATTGGLTAFCTTFIKQYVGRPRPNFFALCGYPYNSVTHTYGTPHLLGSYSSCTKSEADIIHAHTSFPSGHSSWSFAGLGYVSLLLWFTMRSGPAGRPRWAEVLLAAFPLFCASLIACSRTRDNYHHYADVLCGSVLGAVIALAVFWTMYPSPQPRRMSKQPALADRAV